jgi:hypothetical protein
MISTDQSGADFAAQMAMTFQKKAEDKKSPEQKEKEQEVKIEKQKKEEKNDDTERAQEARNELLKEIDPSHQDVAGFDE